MASKGPSWARPIQLGTFGGGTAVSGAPMQSGAFVPGSSSLTEAQSQYRDTQAEAASLGLDPLAGEKKKKKGLLGTLTGAALNVVGEVANAIDVPKRIIISGLKEGTDLVSGGDASWGDFTKQVSDERFGFGSAFAHTGNKWADRLIGLTGDILLDPTTYITFGGSALAKVGAQKGAQLVAKEAGKELAEGAVTKGSRLLAAEAERVAALKTRTVAQDALSTAVNSGDFAAIKAAKATVKQSDDALRAATKTMAVQNTTRRSVGRKARETTAESVRRLRQEALQEASDETLDEATRLTAQKVASTLTDDVIGNIATRGFNAIQGEVADVLGVQSGLRFGVGRFSTYIPGSQKLTDAFGTKLVNKRLNFVNSARGVKILDAVTPMGKAGLFDEQNILKMRNELRSGVAKGKDAVDYVGLLAADQNYRRVTNLQNGRVGKIIADTIGTEDKKLVNSIIDLIETPEAQWAARGINPSPEQLALYKKAKVMTDKFYEEANNAAKALGGEDLPYNENFLPHSQTEDAIRWAERNSRLADKVANELGIDRTYLQQNFVERTLVPGKKWFGHTLTQADIDGGVRKLNEIAKTTRHADGGVNPSPLTFNFFTEDVGEALGKYAYKHARYMAYTDSINKLVDPVVGALDTVKPLTTVTKVGGRKGAQESFDMLNATLSTAFTPAKLKQWEPEQVIKIRDSVDSLAKRFDGDKLLAQEFKDEVLAIDEAVSAINRGIVKGDITGEMGALLNNEIEAHALALRNQIDNIDGKIKTTDPKKWKTISQVVEDGFGVLNPEKITNVQARQEVLDMFQNVKKLDNPKFAEATEKLLGDYNTFFKSWVTATPGFHIRNSIQNTFQMIAAGVNPANGGEAVKIYGRFLGSELTPEQYVKSLKLAPKREKALIEAFSSITPGQYGEVLQEGGTGTAGVFGRTATGDIPLLNRVGVQTPESLRKGARVTSEVLGALPRWSRKLGSNIEDVQRFAFTYDGLMKGLGIDEAAARTTKFLFDYTDLSKADRVLKQVIPFWMWTSRNVPLQFENMLMNPKVYQYYRAGKNALQAEEEEGFISSFSKDAGAFQIAEDIPLIGGMTAKPDLGFPGAGRPAIGSGGGTGDILSSVSPLLRAPLERQLNRETFTGRDIVNEYSELDPGTQKNLYLAGQLLPPTSTIGRYAKAIPGAQGITQGDVSQALLRTPQAFGTPEQQAQMLADQRTRGRYGLLGSPISPLTEGEQISELSRRRKALQAIIDKEKAKQNK